MRSGRDFWYLAVMRRIASLLIAIAAFAAPFPAAAQHTPVIIDDCTPGPYLIQFDRGSTQMQPDGRQILAHVVKNDACLGSGARVMIDGFVARGEPAGLAIRRAVATRDRLIALGLPEDRLYLRASSKAFSSRTGQRWPENATVAIGWRPSEPD